MEVRDLVKRYPQATVNAVDGVSFDVSPGEVFGLLGPNGAGKTTTVGVLTTRVRPTSGIARVAGVDVAADPVRARALLAVVPQRNNLDRSLSVRQNLLFHAAYHGVPAAVRSARADELLGVFGLADRAGDRVDRLSGGQAQRVMIARALMHTPLVLFLDEPTTGLDPAARLFVWDRIRELRDQGVTVVITTHDMDEATALAERVGIMDHGRLLALDAPQALTRSLPGSTTLDLALAIGDDGRAGTVIDALAGLRGVERVERIEREDGWEGAGADDAAQPSAGYAPARAEAADGARGPLRVRLYVSGDAPLMLAPVAELLARHGITLSDVKIGEPSLEDVFIELTGRALR
ncbi:MAG: ABC transporter ATP-binding protein [Gaiellales bacterium]